MRVIAFLLMTTLPSFAFAQASQGVIIRCGASEGHSFFFKGFANPDGPNWDADRISEGKIILVRLGEEWDIQFDDAIGAYGHRQDGANVVPLIATENLITVGAFNTEYVSIYTFDLANKVVGWTTNKHGPIVPKSAAYSADCD